MNPSERRYVIALIAVGLLVGVFGGLLMLALLLELMGWG